MKRTRPLNRNDSLSNSSIFFSMLSSELLGGYKMVIILGPFLFSYFINTDISRGKTYLVYEYLLLLRLYSSLTVGCEDKDIFIFSKKKIMRSFGFFLYCTRDIEHII